MLRIFLTSSQLSTVYMSLYAKKSKKAGDYDVLIIDNFFKKKSLLELINDAALIHDWDSVINQSLKIEDTHDLKPGLKKRILRKVKNFPVIKYVYKGLLDKSLKNYAKTKAEELALLLGEAKLMKNIQLNLLTQTALNKPLHVLFPDAEICYFEHGQGDYYYILKPDMPKGKFICVFEKEYKKMLAFRGINSDFVKPLTNKDEFEQACLVAGKRCESTMNEIKKRDKKFVLFLMDASEIYHPPINFWTDYIEECLKQMVNRNEFCFLVKPHPSQSNEVMKITEDYFKLSGLDFIMLDKPEFVPLSAEYIYVSLSTRIEAVFTTFSSAIFYLAHFYPENSKFYLLYDFVGKYFTNAPAQYREIFGDLDRMYKEMFDELPLIRVS